MKESEIRDVLRLACDDFDARAAMETARRPDMTALVRSMVVGASLGLTGCSIPVYASVDAHFPRDASIDGTSDAFVDATDTTPE